MLYVKGYRDPATKRNIVLWEDILIPFKGATYIRQGATVVPFLKGQDFKNLEPLRIAAVPNVILEVVVTESQSAGEVTAVKGKAKELAVETGTEAQEAMPTSASKVAEADKVVIKTEPQEPIMFIVDDVEDMDVKEEPRDDEVVMPNVVMAMQKEKEKVKEKAAITYSTNDNHNNISRSNSINNINSTNGDNAKGDSASRNNTHISKTTSNSANSNKVTEQDENVVEAEQELMAAERGDAEAQFRVGSKYRRGQGLPQSNTKSRKWYLRAAGQGHSNAQFKLGMLLENGDINVAKDLVTAVDWYHKAANHGHPEAQFRLGVLYGKGTGAPRDDNMALMWYTRAAEQGVELAQLAVGIQYHQGRVGVPSDNVKALTWLAKAAETGNADAQHLIGQIYYSGGNNIRRNFTEAMEWFHRAANNERGAHSGALHGIGLLYREGLGVERDWVMAKEWYLKVTTAEPKKDDKEMAPFWFSIGDLSFHGGPGIVQDYFEAMEWFLKAAIGGNVKAMYQIGLCYERGYPNGERNESALEWFRMAAARGHHQAQERVNPRRQAQAQKRKQRTTPAYPAKKQKAATPADPVVTLAAIAADVEATK